MSDNKFINGLCFSSRSQICRPTPSWIFNEEPQGGLGRGVREGSWIWQNALTPQSVELWVLKKQVASSRRAGRSPKVGNENRGSFPQTNTPQKVETAILKHTVIYFFLKKMNLRVNKCEQSWGELEMNGVFPPAWDLQEHPENSCLLWQVGLPPCRSVPIS